MDTLANSLSHLASLSLLNRSQIDRQIDGQTDSSIIIQGLSLCSVSYFVTRWHEKNNQVKRLSVPLTSVSFVINNTSGILEMEARVTGLQVTRLERLGSDVSVDVLCSAMLAALLTRHGPVGWCDATAGISTDGARATTATASEEAAIVSLSEGFEEEKGADAVVEDDIVEGTAVGTAEADDAQAAPPSAQEQVAGLNAEEKQMLTSRCDQVK